MRKKKAKRRKIVVVASVLITVTIITCLVVLWPRPKPAAFEVSNLRVNPTEALVGDTVTITADVRNVGEVKGTYVATLTINGVRIETKDILVAGGATETVTFTLVNDAAGTYGTFYNTAYCDIEVDGLTRSLTVKRTRITGLTVDNIDPKVENCTIKSGASMVISVGIQSSKTIENVEVHVWAIWTRRWNKYQIDESRIVRLEAGEHRMENFETTAYCSPCAGINPGPYGMYVEISIDDVFLDNYETTIYLVE